jgi:contact-dependent growth inhibition (CDI) system restriction endonuclease-like protein
MTYHMWRLSEAGPDNLGLACTDDGLLLGGTPLIERRDGRFVVRDRDEIEQLLQRGHRYIGEADRLMPGLATVARALNTGDRCLARIAAVHLKLPDLPNQAARDAMEAEDSLIKYARDGGGIDWNPALHPRAGTPPNPGWFAPTDGASHDSPGARVAENDNPTRRSDASSDAVENWVHLPPGKYVNDELADFVEWIANARAEDEQAIRPEIKRYYYDVGDLHGGNALTAALSRALQPGVSLEDRKFIAEWVSRYARYDPAVFGQDTNFIYSVLGFLSPWLLGRALPKRPAISPEIELETAQLALSAEQRAAIWKLTPTTRGKVIDKIFRRGSLHPLSRTIDDFTEEGVTISNKSIDLNAATYQKSRILSSRANKYLGELEGYQGTDWGGDTIEPSQITGRALRLIIPKGSITPAQREALVAAAKIARSKGLRLLITEF